MLKLALLLALIASSLGGQQPLIDEGFTHFYNLDYDQAIAVFEKAIAQYPGLPDLHNHRSEEHTSELQSRQYLVCRLLLEKKKKPKINSTHNLPHPTRRVFGLTASME